MPNGSAPSSRARAFRLNPRVQFDSLAPGTSAGLQPSHAARRNPVDDDGRSLQPGLRGVRRADLMTKADSQEPSRRRRTQIRSVLAALREGRRKPDPRGATDEAARPPVGATSLAPSSRTSPRTWSSRSPTSIARSSAEPGGSRARRSTAPTATNTFARSSTAQSSSKRPRSDRGVVLVNVANILPHMAFFEQDFDSPKMGSDFLRGIQELFMRERFDSPSFLQRLTNGGRRYVARQDARSSCSFVRSSSTCGRLRRSSVTSRG